MHKLLEYYINKLSINDIKEFANKNGADFSDNELKLIYKYVKNDWETIIFGNADQIFSDLKKNLTAKNYQITTNLFEEYKEKFKNYL